MGVSGVYIIFLIIAQNTGVVGTRENCHIEAVLTCTHNLYSSRNKKFIQNFSPKIDNKAVKLQCITLTRSHNELLGKLNKDERSKLNFRSWGIAFCNIVVMKCGLNMSEMTSVWVYFQI